MSQLWREVAVRCCRLKYHLARASTRPHTRCFSSLTTPCMERMWLALDGMKRREDIRGVLREISDIELLLLKMHLLLEQTIDAAIRSHLAYPENFDEMKLSLYKKAQLLNCFVKISVPLWSFKIFVQMAGLDSVCKCIWCGASSACRASTGWRVRLGVRIHEYTSRGRRV